MVAHEILVDGVGLEAPRGTFQTAHIDAPVILTMHNDDFPGRFLQDLASRGQPQVSSAVVAGIPADPLYQPVQRMTHVAMVQIACKTLGYPRLDPRRVVSAGIVIRRVHGDYMQAWMRSANGLFQWMDLRGKDAADEDPNPALRPAHPSGQAALDLQLSALRNATAYTESSSPAFVAPPATCANLGRTVIYGLVPTASSEMSDALAVVAPQYKPDDVAKSLPPLLQAKAHSAPLAGTQVNYCWMSSEFLSQQFPPSGTPPKPAHQVVHFQWFSTALILLKSAFGAFDDTSEGAKIMGALNKHNVSVDGEARRMGEFYRDAASKLLDYDPSAGPAQNVTMPDSWDALTTDDVNLLVSALAPKSTAMLMPQGRFQNPARWYRLRLFVRVKSEHPNCPPRLFWSRYSEKFNIAPWYQSSGRPHVPVPLPDPTDRSFLKNIKPDCSFSVPGGLMGAMQGTSMSGLMSGAGGGAKLGMGWLCSFSIPLITICAFFVLNIFLSLLNIVFFWMAFIKICIPIPTVEGDQN